MDDFVAMILQHHPHQRPHIDQILAHIETARRQATEIWTEGGDDGGGDGFARGASGAGGGVAAGDFANFAAFDSFQTSGGGGGGGGGGGAASEVEIATFS